MGATAAHNVRRRWLWLRAAVVAALVLGWGGITGTATAPAATRTVALAVPNIDLAPARFTQTGRGGVASLDANGAVAADLDNDGHQDVALIAPWMGHSLVILYGTGAGGFSPPQTIDVGLVNNNVVAADLDRDGRRDLVVTTAGSVLTLHNAGHRRFTQTSRNILWQTPFQGSAVAADFTGDGNIDVAVKAVNGIKMLLGDGRGHLTRGPLTTIPRSTLGEIAMLDRGNLDGDARADLVAGLAVTQRVVALRGRGDGTFTIAATAAVPVVPTTTKAGDVTGDGLDDVVVLPEASKASHSVAVLRNLGAGRLSSPQYYNGGFGNPNGALADLNGDRHLDVISVNTFTGNLVLLAGHGDGTLSAAGRVGTAVNAQTPVAADFTEDGRLDLAVPTACPGFLGASKVCLAVLINRS